MLHRTLVLTAATAGFACASAAPAGAACSSGAIDKPDLGFVDSNCDGIDGDKAAALFVAPGGDDNHSGSFDSPKKTVLAAVNAGLAAGKDVYDAGGTYPSKVPFSINGHLGVYGGYDAQAWQRSAANVTTLEAPGQVVGVGVPGILLQLLTIHSTDGSSALGPYGARAFGDGTLALSRVTIKTAKGADGGAGAPSPPPPARAPDGSTATYNNCSTWAGPGGTGEGYVWGGWGGDWQDQQFPMKGHDGKSDPNDPSISGGMGGTSPGQNGGSGTSGHPGIHGPGGSATLNRTASYFEAEPGGSGTTGTRGAGGGGGAAGADICLPGSGG